ncbi:hypothetical protein [Chelatococcus sp. XZ-Ab1]|uniref:hypothetical protein n=1 Tax=Chelatococcus sp. XZ-Ab1 TaxID=3034027 RepID=UPI0023E3D906|nr:hypothetical protein [Chelatococcus sp. XZ-Ab1]
MIRGLHLSPTERRVERDGVAAILVGTHFRALELMLQAHPAAVHRDDILDHVAGAGRARLYSDERYTSRLISGARQAMQLLGCDVVLAGRSSWRVVDLCDERTGHVPSVRAHEGSPPRRQACLGGHRLSREPRPWERRGGEAQAPAPVVGVGAAAPLDQHAVHAALGRPRGRDGDSAHPARNP